MGVFVHSFFCLFQPQYGSIAFRHCWRLPNRPHRCAGTRITPPEVARYSELVDGRNLMFLLAMKINNRELSKLKSQKRRFRK